MEQHPIPQDVTGFQFKLIGTMTVKQFGYVAGGAILAVICWYAPVQGILWNLVTKGLLLPFFGILGVIVAFVPIEGRPVDVMATNFFHALITPNQYIYIKRGRKFSFTQVSYVKTVSQQATEQKTTNPRSLKMETKKEQQLRAFLSSSYKLSKSNIDKKEAAFLQTFTTLPQPAAAVMQPVTRPQINIPATQTPKPILPIKADMPPPPVAKLPPQPAQQNLTPPQDVMNALLPGVVSNIAPIVHPKPQLQSPIMDAAHVHNIPQAMTKNAGFSNLSDTPNIIVGIVKDSRGNILPNILVEVKDKDGNPVRAFKTNPLGQFASATPLTNGTYTIDLEDPKKQHAFDVIQITTNGQIVLPVEIISHDAREELRKALFN